jgi:hypothetical protein
MKRLVLLSLILTTFCQVIQSQKTDNKTEAKSPKFSVGVSYSYLSWDLRLAGLSEHSIWYGTDYGTNTLSRDQIKEVNDQIDRNNEVNNVNVEFGINLFDSPESGWKGRMTLLGGIARTNATMHNNVTDTNEYIFDSKLYKPCLGIGFDMEYAFDKRWGLAIKPYFVSTFGQTEKITDNINVVPEGFSQATSDTYRSFYQRLSLLATFSTGHFVFSAGPGLYLAVSHHEYVIQRVYISTGDRLLDEINSRSINRSFADASLSIRWKVAGPVSLYVFSGIGRDIIVNGGLVANF